MTLKDGPLVSIVTPTLNGMLTIEETFDSILNQTYTGIQYIVIDGGSTDGTLGIIGEYEPKFKDAGIAFEWVSETDKGIYDAMNKGIERASGSLIGILNSDDCYEPDAVLEMVSAYHQRNHDLVIFHGKVRRMNFKGETQSLQEGESDISPATLFREMPINHPSTFVCREVYERIGLFDTCFRLSADYEFTVRAYFKGVAFVRVERVIAAMRSQGASQRLHNRKTRISEDYRIRRRYFGARRKAAVACLMYKLCKYHLTVVIRHFLK